MAKCKSCNAKVLRTDAFCGTCGEPVPGAKPLVPIARISKPSGVQSQVNPVSGTFASEGASATSARALAVVAVSDPADGEPPSRGVNQTTIRERERSEPAPVLPLNRKKHDTGPQPRVAGSVSTTKSGEPRASVPERETTSLPNMPVPAGPPILASDLLREQMRPSSPGGKALRWVTLTLSGLGALAAILLGGAHSLTMVALALLIAMGTLALTPMSYRGRAISLFGVGLVATGVALWQQTIYGVAHEGTILAGATILLSGSLLFRAYYRGARLARVAVLLGVLALGAWFVMSGGHESLVTLEGHWQSWAPASTHMMFGLLALLSLLAFMESSTRGGSHVWAVALLVLYAVHIAVLLVSQIWPAGGVAQVEVGGPMLAAIVTGLVGAIVAGMALAQVFVLAHRATLRGI